MKMKPTMKSTKKKRVTGRRHIAMITLKKVDAMVNDATGLSTTRGRFLRWGCTNSKVGRSGGTGWLYRHSFSFGA